jgi:hypothetical protein
MRRDCGARQLRSAKRHGLGARNPHPAFRQGFPNNRSIIKPVRERASQRTANAMYYWLNREREIARVRTRQQATLVLLRRLRTRPCAECGQSFEPHQMDFDHRDPWAKSFRLTSGCALLTSRHRLRAEINKCDVVCANCHRLRTRARALLSPGKVLPGSSKYIQRKRDRWRMHARLLDRLRDVPCHDCHGRFPPCAMDFDHRDAATKAAGVTRLVGRAGTNRILAEVAKCDIVCANCHRSRTAARRAAPPERE